MKIYTDEEIKQITAEYNALRQKGYSKNRAIEELGKKYYVHMNTIGNYVKAWEG